ncbi:RPS16-2 [Scenedesmus sp. PABB004]|nr:RPS16-2 [Scenedesmus sp. PABB004]
MLTLSGAAPPPAWARAAGPAAAAAPRLPLRATFWTAARAHPDAAGAAAPTAAAPSSARPGGGAAAARSASQKPPFAMLLRIRLARFGRKHLPFYKLVVAQQRAPRDGKHLEVVGWYDPQPAADGNKHMGLKFDRIKYWLAIGAAPSDRVTFLLSRAGLIPPPPAPPRFPKPAAPAKKG